MKTKEELAKEIEDRIKLLKSTAGANWNDGGAKFEIAISNLYIALSNLYK